MESIPIGVVSFFFQKICSFQELDRPGSPQISMVESMAYHKI